MNFIDVFLNRITMYRLVLYYLIVLLVSAFVSSLLGILDYSAITMLFSTLFIVAVCWLTNVIFADVFEVVPNIESVYISALILALIITPSPSINNFLFLLWASIVTISSKYILAFNKKHIFNPVAIAGVILSLTTHQAFSWWIGTKSLLPIVLIGGLLIIRKIHRFNMVATFLTTAFLAIIVLNLFSGKTLLSSLSETFLYSPLIFFGTIMLTEPLTSPPNNYWQMAYGALAGFLFLPQVHLFGFYTTPELALVYSNIFSYLVSPKYRYILKLQEKLAIGSGIYDYLFSSDKKLSFIPGQYLELTLKVPSPDSRGNRRYFTIASSPTETTVRFGVKFYEKPSRFKQELLSLAVGDTVTASSLSGSFTLPKNDTQKSVFIAGGIGVTPFRSILKYLLDTNQKRDIVHFYSNKTVSELAYTDIFNQAELKLGIKTIHTLTDLKQIPPNWLGQTGLISQAMIIKQVPDYQERIFYLSGPHAMVVAFEKLLAQMNVPRSQIKTDYFPGFV